MGQHVQRLAAQADAEQPAVTVPDLLAPADTGMRLMMGHRSLGHVFSMIPVERAEGLALDVVGLKDDAIEIEKYGLVAAHRFNTGTDGQPPSRAGSARSIDGVGFAAGIGRSSISM